MVDIKFDERMIQTLIWRYYNFGVLIPNIYTDKDSRTEVDALHISTSGYPIFFEIKISKSDFKADLKKTRHRRLMNRETYENSFFIKPNQFWYVIHGFTVGLDEIPEYAGLVEVNDYSGVSLHKPFKQAPILWTEKLNLEHWDFINRKLLYRVMENTMREKNGEWENMLMEIMHANRRRKRNKLSMK